MASDRQIAANRANAQHCTGPTSPAGLARSSQNALKHGLDSKSEVMRCESRPDYEALIAEYYERFHPTVPEERAPVDMLIKSEWHSRRYMSIDAGIWERGFLVINDRSLGRVFELSGKAFDRVDRRINSAQRNFQKALRQLLDIRAKRAKEADLEIQPTDPAETAIETEPLNPKLVSFLQNTSEPATPPAPPAENAPTLTANHPKKEDDPPIAA